MFDRMAIYRIKSTGQRQLIYRDDLDYMLKDDELTAEDVDLLPISEATPRELAKLIGSEMENANYHSMTSLAEDVLTGMEEDNFTEAQQTKVLNLIFSGLSAMI